MTYATHFKNITKKAVGVLGALALVLGLGTASAYAAQTSPVTVQVQPGDTLSEIAMETTGSMDIWNEIALVNGVFDPTELQVGRDVIVPATVTVEPGDTLSEIAVEHTGDIRTWDDIAYFNGITEPTQMQPGRTLVLSQDNTSDLGILVGTYLQAVAESYNNEIEQIVDEEVAEFMVFGE